MASSPTSRTAPASVLLPNDDNDENCTTNRSEDDYAKSPRTNGDETDESQQIVGQDSTVTPLSLIATRSFEKRAENSQDNNNPDGIVHVISDDDLERAPPTEVHKRRLGWIQLAVMGFLFTSSGPSGLEPVVRNGGPLLAFVGIFLTPLLYAWPQVLVVAELGAMMPTNHGNIIWVNRAFGNFAGFYNGWNNVLTNAVDVATYAALFGDYLTTAFYPDPPFFIAWAARAVCVVFGTILALLPSHWVGNVASVLTLSVLLPYAVGFFIQTPNLSTSHWGETSEEIHWGKVLSGLLWLYTGWTSLGSLAGEVAKPRTLFYGLSAAVTIDFLVYLLPFLAALEVAGNWKDGFFVTAFGHIWHPLKEILGVAVPLTTIGVFSTAMLCYARTMWGVGELKWGPKILTRTIKRSGAPYVGVLVNAFCALGLVAFKFDVLVEVEYTIAAVSYILVFTAFLRLRYSEPDAHRPFLVPGGKPVAWLITLVKLLIWVAMLVTGLMNWHVAIAFVVCNLGITAAYFATCQHRSVGTTYGELHQRFLQTEE